MRLADSSIKCNFIINIFVFVKFVFAKLILVAIRIIMATPVGK
jgi:hypothetical protein